MREATVIEDQDQQAIADAEAVAVENFIRAAGELNEAGARLCQALEAQSTAMRALIRSVLALHGETIDFDEEEEP